MKLRHHRGSLSSFLSAGVAVVALSACGGGSGGGPVSPSMPGPSPTSGVGGALAPQADSVYLGAWADPTGSAPGTSTQHIAALETAIGRKLELSMHYDDMSAAFPSFDEMADLENGRVPIVSLNCDGTDFNIAAGSRDAELKVKAAEIKAYGKPVMLRYKWEFNLPYTANGRSICADPARDTNGYFSAPDFVNAYRHIHDLMVAGGAANIVWVWNPSAGGVSGVPFWPGDAYVDWTGIDVYDRDSEGTSIFNTPYAMYARLGNGTHPMIVGETGSVAAGQTQFLKALPAALRGSYPTIKALVYFDGAGVYDYSLTPAGLAAFRVLGADPYLSAVVP